MKVRHVEGELVAAIGLEIARLREAGLMATVLELSKVEYDQLTGELGGEVWAFPIGGGMGLPIEIDGKAVKPPTVVVPGGGPQLGQPPGGDGQPRR